MNKLPPMPPNLGAMNYPLFGPIVDILDAISRFEQNPILTFPQAAALPLHRHVIARVVYHKRAELSGTNQLDLLVAKSLLRHLKYRIRP